MLPNISSAARRGGRDPIATHVFSPIGFFLFFVIIILAVTAATVVDSFAAWIDHRVMVTPFNAEKTLTKDTVPVDVDAVLFWMVWDAQKASLEVENYRSAIARAAQTALREIIGSLSLAD